MKMNEILTDELLDAFATSYASYIKLTSHFKGNKILTFGEYVERKLASRKRVASEWQKEKELAQ